MLKTCLATLVGLTLVLSALHVAYAQTVPCPVCGIEVREGAKVTVERKDGRKIVYGCPKCAFTTEKIDQIKHATVTDFLTSETVDARQATYLLETEIGVGDPPHWLAFATRERAEKFAKGFGGDVETFDEMIEEIRTGEHAGHDPEHERYRHPHHDESHEHDWDK